MRSQSRNRNNFSVKTAYFGLLLGLAILFGYVEGLLPPPVPMPGVKLGLANVVIVSMLYLTGFREALLISILRVVIIGILFGNVFSIVYGLAGALLSLTVMALLKRVNRFSVIGVSAAGGWSHGAGQMIVACLILKGFPWQWYLPVLMLSGLFTGILTGAVNYLILPRIRREIGRVQPPEPCTAPGHQNPESQSF